MFKRKPVLSIFMTIVTIQSILLLICVVIVFINEGKNVYKYYLCTNIYGTILLVLATISIIYLILINLLYFGEKFIVSPEGLITIKFLSKKKILWNNVVSIDKKGSVIVIKTIDKCICVHSSKAAEDALPIMLDNMMKFK